MEFNGSLTLYNTLGQIIKVIHQGKFKGGSRKYFIDASYYKSGVYYLKLENNKGVKTTPFLVR